MNSGVFDHVGRLEFNDFFPKNVSVDKSVFNCYLLQGNMDKVLKEVIQTGSEYISDDIGSNSVMTEVSFESVIRSLKIGTGCYNSVLSLDLSVYSELESVEIGDFSFRSCVRFKCSGLKNLHRLVIGNGCFSRIEWYDSESNDEYDGYDSESDIDEENEYYYDDSEEYGTAYGLALKKAFNHAMNMYKEGYVPAVVVIGDLENEGDVSKQIDWNTLPEDVANIRNQANEFSMMFLFAKPEKLDLVKEKLTPVLGENKLIIGSETTSNKSLRRFLNSIGR